jgi:hypothetical protein
VKRHFENLYSEEGMGDIIAQERLLDNIPPLISFEDNDGTNSTSNRNEIYGVLQQMNLIRL